MSVASEEPSVLQRSTQRPPISPRQSVTTNRTSNIVPWARKSAPANGDIPQIAMHRKQWTLLTHVMLCVHWLAFISGILHITVH